MAIVGIDRVVAGVDRVSGSLADAEAFIAALGEDASGPRADARISPQNVRAPPVRRGSTLMATLPAGGILPGQDHMVDAHG